MNTTIRTKIFTALSCVLGSAALGTVLPAYVQAADAPTKADAPIKTVHYGDLDVTRAEGAKVLYNRLRTAAQDVCKPATESDPFMRQAVKACIDNAIDQAVKDVNSPALTNLRFGGNAVRLASK